MKNETKVLLNEFIKAHENELWNSVVLIYRPLLIHLVSEILKLDETIMANLDYSEVINIMEKAGIITDPLLLAETKKMKIAANKINHRQSIVEEADARLAAEIIRIIINTNKRGN